MAHRVELNTRTKCFLCDNLFNPWAILELGDKWVCRACTSYEGNHRLPIVLNNTYEMKRTVTANLRAKIESIENMAFHVKPDHPIVVTMPPNYTCYGECCNNQPSASGQRPEISRNQTNPKRRANLDPKTCPPKPDQEDRCRHQ